MSNMDEQSLEERIRSELYEFSDAPDPGTWEKLEGRLREKEPRRRPLLWILSAAAALLVGTLALNEFVLRDQEGTASSVHVRGSDDDRHQPTKKEGESLSRSAEENEEANKSKRASRIPSQENRDDATAPDKKTTENGDDQSRMRDRNEAGNSAPAGYVPVAGNKDNETRGKGLITGSKDDGTGASKSGVDEHLDAIPGEDASNINLGEIETREEPPQMDDGSLTPPLDVMTDQRFPGDSVDENTGGGAREGKAVTAYVNGVSPEDSTEVILADDNADSDESLHADLAEGEKSRPVRSWTVNAFAGPSLKFNGFRGSESDAIILRDLSKSGNVFQSRRGYRAGVGLEWFFASRWKFSASGFYTVGKYETNFESLTYGTADIQYIDNGEMVLIMPTEIRSLHRYREEGRMFGGSLNVAYRFSERLPGVHFAGLGVNLGRTDVKTNYDKVSYSSATRQSSVNVFYEWQKPLTDEWYISLMPVYTTRIGRSDEREFPVVRTSTYDISLLVALGFRFR